ncbi:MAG: hypothetical protein HYS17_04440 [Micavibrio aeruginosavorus]|uniref:Uncharacterized protein n=1 Tax=Micavibrio aeruginosavorus TaxID=349221 RepID=A0A7T5R3R2_9BACT|nr:MAG: hypothetical protein HYS17_04440 [Micavibrio aeruginosavorus]
MSFLDGLTKDEVTLLVSLPYRAGLWVSHADDKGQGAGKTHELKTIEGVISRLSEGMIASAFVHEVMQATHVRRDEWPSWSLQTGTVPDEARAVVVLLKRKMMPQDAEAYVQTIMSIAYETAYAFREFDRTASIPIRLWVGLQLAWEAFIRTGNKDYRLESLTNISLAEDEAIAVLAQALTLEREAPLLANAS